MSRKPNTDINGNSFAEITKIRVWSKATIVPHANPEKKRKDLCGAWIEWDKYGDTTQNGRGWEIDHIKPVSKGGTDDISNLQPLQWQNNRKKGDDYPVYRYCEITNN